MSSLEAVFLQGIKCAIFVRQSTTMRMLSNDFDGGRSIKKSIDTEDHGRLGIGNDYKSP